MKVIAAPVIRLFLRRSSGQAAPLGIVCGTGVIKGLIAEVGYFALTREGQTRTFPIHGNGWHGLESGYLGTEQAILAWAAEAGGPMVLVGHSQGVLHVVRFALDHPELVKEVILLAGPLDGTDHVNRIPSWLRPLFGTLLPSVLDMAPGSVPIQELQARVSQDWPRGVRVQMIVGSGERFVVPRRSAFALEFPGSVRAKRRFLSLWQPKLPAEIDTQIEHVFAPLVGHLTMIFHPVVIEIIRRARRRPRLVQPQPALQPVA